MDHCHCNPRGFRRIITQVVIFLLLGAILNIAVAWGCALWSKPDYKSSRVEARDALPDEVATYVPTEVLERFRREIVNLTPHFRQSDGLGISETEACGIRGPLESGPCIAVILTEIEVRYLGLPCRAMGHVEYLNTGSMSTKWFGGLEIPDALRPRSARPISLVLRYHRRFPLLPVWPSFLVNTVFYAAILWLLIPGPFVLRRLIRRRRVHCINCGYDLRGDLDAGCPECGWGRGVTV